jgi:2-polyprenyl-3-methyl-5-hydroxy-6-metoxy-1,4-benzoquinol methylase
MMIHVADGASVLDIGCGGGLFLGLLAATRRGIRGYGTDYSEAAIDAARHMAKAAAADGSDATLDFNVVDAQSGLTEGLFDVVSIVDVAHHLPPRTVAPLLKAAASRVTPDGGTLIYKDMAAEPLWQASANRLHDLVIARQWISYVPVQRVEEILGECGLSLIRAEVLNCFWYRHELRVFKRGAAS